MFNSGMAVCLWVIAIVDSDDGRVGRAVVNDRHETIFSEAAGSTQGSDRWTHVASAALLRDEGLREALTGLEWSE